MYKTHFEICFKSLHFAQCKWFTMLTRQNHETKKVNVKTVTTKLQLCTKYLKHKIAIVKTAKMLLLYAICRETIVGTPSVVIILKN